MSDKFTKLPKKEQGGMGIEAWMQQHCNVDKQLSLSKGFTILCKDLLGMEQKLPVNRVGILMENCSMMRTGNNSNHGSGGSNCATGTPVHFVDLVSVFPAVFKNSYTGILGACKQPCFILPLCQLAEATDMNAVMEEAYADFVSLSKGNNAHDETHVANGICSGLAAICFSLCHEITINGSKPNVDRMKFLVEALYTLGLTAHSVAKHSVKCDNIFKLMPYVANTADTFQSTLMSFIFDKIPCETIRVKQVGSSIFRHFNKNGWTTSYVDTTPVGLIGLLLIAPMLSGMLTTEIDTSEIINTIVRALNDATTSIVEEYNKMYFEKGSNYDTTDAIHLRNKMILRGFAKATKVSLVHVDQIDKIYDAVLRGERDIATAIGVAEHAPFIKASTNFIMNGKSVTNYPIMAMNHESTGSITATYIPADPREWTGITLHPGAKYTMKATPLGIAEFRAGKTMGEQNIANFRFTAGCDLLKGQYPGYAASGMYYNPARKSFTEAPQHMHINPNNSFTIASDSVGIFVRQGICDVLRILNNGDLNLSPTISFKNCVVEITLVAKIPLVSDHKKEATPTPTPSITKPEIESCISLAESLNAVRVIGSTSVRKDTQGQHSWGQTARQNYVQSRTANKK